MVLVDTSVWVDFLRHGDKELSLLLSQSRVCTHPMVIGELACGHLQNRKPLIALWRSLPFGLEASHDEAIFLLESHKLAGKGIGFVDLHLLASTQLSPNTQLWTRDKRLSGIANTLGINFINH